MEDKDIDKDILDVIQGLAAEELWIRGQREKGQMEPAAADARLAEVKGRLDEMWASLRRRRAALG